MIIGYDYFFGQDESSIFQTIVPIGTINKMIIGSGKYDEISIDEDISKTYNTTKEDWDYEFVFNAKFQDNLEGGNIDNQGQTVAQIKFQKRLSDSLTWQDIAIMEYSTLQTVYTTLDRYVKSGYEYEYAVLPVTSSVSGRRSTASITPSFDGIFICDKDVSFQLIMNLELGDIEHVNPSSILEPLNSQFPIVQYSVLDYKKSNVKALVLSTETLESNGNIIDAKTEYENRKRLMTFLKNHKPKIFKSSSGEFMIISVVDNPRETPNNSLAQAIADISFNFVETDDSENNQALIDNGLVVL